mmetsp:Transcript_15421/g.26769  ORF Transcript_15421/g.26769 Transcript_15421/m.26769 type:complete len:352 (+) Transcript_15421:417-1472(+)
MFRDVFRVQVGAKVGEPACLESFLVVLDGSHFRQADAVVNGLHLFGIDGLALHNVAKDHPSTGTQHSRGFEDGLALTGRSGMQESIHGDDQVCRFVSDADLQIGLFQDVNVLVGSNVDVATTGLFAHFSGNVASGGLPDESLLPEATHQSTVSASQIDNAKTVVGVTGEGVRLDELDEFLFVEFFGAEDLLLQGESLSVLFRQEVVAADVKFVFSPDIVVELLGIVGIVVGLGLAGALLVEPSKDGESGTMNVRVAVLGRLFNVGNVDVVGPQEALHLNGRLPVRQVVGGRNEDPVVPVHVLVEVKGSAQRLVLLVVVDEGMGEEVSVPVGDEAQAVGTCKVEHFVDKGAT